MWQIQGEAHESRLSRASTRTCRKTRHMLVSVHSGVWNVSQDLDLSGLSGERKGTCGSLCCWILIQGEGQQVLSVKHQEYNMTDRVLSILCLSRKLLM